MKEKEKKIDLWIICVLVSVAFVLVNISMCLISSNVGDSLGRYFYENEQIVFKSPLINIFTIVSVLLFIGCLPLLVVTIVGAVTSNRSVYVKILRVLAAFAVVISTTVVSSISAYIIQLADPLYVWDAPSPIYKFDYELQSQGHSFVITELHEGKFRIYAFDITDKDHVRKLGRVQCGIIPNGEYTIEIEDNEMTIYPTKEPDSVTKFDLE